VLEKKKRKELQVTWLCAAEVQLSLAHRTVRWCTGQCPVRQAVSGEKATLGKSLAAYGYNSPDCPVSQWSSAPTVGRAIRRRRMATPTVGSGHQTVRCAPDSVRCANWPRVATVICARKGRRSTPDCLQWLSGGAPDCPVRHSTEGKDGLPCWLPTAPSCLGAIKGTPRRMEELPKLTRNILRLQDSNFTHSIL
jgi:hypothetical protein